MSEKPLKHKKEIVWESIELYFKSTLGVVIIGTNILANFGEFVLQLAKRQPIDLTQVGGNVVYFVAFGFFLFLLFFIYVFFRSIFYNFSFLEERLSSIKSGKDFLSDHEVRIEWNKGKTIGGTFLSPLIKEKSKKGK